MAISTVQLTVLVLGILLVLALIYIFYNWFTNRKSGEEINSLDEVVVDGRKGDRPDHGTEEIFHVSSRFKEILSEDRRSNHEERKEDQIELADIQPKSIIDNSIHNEYEEVKSARVVYLSSQAIKRHIFPNCRGDKDAERFSTRRNKSSQTFKNTVLKVERWDFHLENGGAYLRSNSKVQFWQCSRRDYLGNFQVGKII